MKWKGGRSLVRGSLYVFLWYTSILCGFFTLCAPALPILLLSPRAYRHVQDVIFAVWEFYPVALMELLFGTRTVVSGDQVVSGERSILVMNHRTRLDWNFLWAAMHYATSAPAHRLKFVLKAPIRHWPGPGWVMQMAGFFYIHRDWARDQRLLADMVHYLRDIQHTYQVLIFPEGTDMTSRSIRQSNEYADRNQLPHYFRVLHPKTTGFACLAHNMNSSGQLDAVYDLTVGYPGSLPETELDALAGVFPETVHVHVTRYPVSELPKEEAQLKEWLAALWRKKEALLTQFYERKRFPGDTQVSDRPKPAPTHNSLYLSLLFWTSLVLLTFYLLLTSLYFQLYCLAHAALFALLSLTSEGLQHLELVWFNFLNRHP